MGILGWLTGKKKRTPKHPFDWLKAQLIGLGDDIVKETDKNRNAKRIRPLFETLNDIKNKNAGLEKRCESLSGMIAKLAEEKESSNRKEIIKMILATIESLNH